MDAEALRDGTLVPRSRGTPFDNHEIGVRLVGQDSIMVNPNQRSRVTDTMDLIELARHVQTADSFTKANATNKLTIILDQIRYLQEQARKVLEDAHQDQSLHHVPCNFKKVPGKLYYLYEKVTRNGGMERLFSMLSPQEWGKSCPYRFMGAYKLQYDMSWTAAADVAEKEQDLTLIDRFLLGSGAKRIGFDPFVTEVPESGQN